MHPTQVREAHDQPETDQYVWLRGVSWAQYTALADSRGESASPRFMFLDGELQIMSPGRAHEDLSRKLGRLVETYAVERGLALFSTGSLTVRGARKRAGLEPDESFSLGAAKDVPDLAIEIKHTGGGSEKLTAYARLGVPEVWIWEGERLTVFVLTRSSYRVARRSRLLPGLDLTLLEACLAEPQPVAIAKLIAALRAPKRARRRR